jgi:hypothetical protein
MLLSRSIRFSLTRRGSVVMWHAATGYLFSCSHTMVSREYVQISREYDKAHVRHHARNHANMSSPNLARIQQKISPEITRGIFHSSDIGLFWHSFILRWRDTSLLQQSMNWNCRMCVHCGTFFLSTDAKENLSSHLKTEHNHYRRTLSASAFRRHRRWIANLLLRLL